MLGESQNQSVNATLEVNTKQRISEVNCRVMDQESPSPQEIRKEKELQKPSPIITLECSGL